MDPAWNDASEVTIERSTVVIQQRNIDQGTVVNREAWHLGYDNVVDVRQPKRAHTSAEPLGHKL